MGIRKYISKNRLGLILKNKRFSELTTIKVGGEIKSLFYPATEENLIKVLEYLSIHKKKFLVLGNGSNIVASDRVFKPLVISGKHLVKNIIYNEDTFTVSAFMDLRIVVAKLVEQQISTLTNLAGIPGTIGGALVMNAGAYKSTISDNLVWVKFVEDGKIQIKRKEELNFRYRSSSLKKEGIVILEAEFSIVKDSQTLFVYKNILQKRRERQPLNYPNCGSIFRNTEALKAYEIIRLINLNDYVIGGAKFSEKHANFIVNFDNAKAKDIYNLIILAKKRALFLENIELKEEVILLNFLSYKLLSKYLKK